MAKLGQDVFGIKRNAQCSMFNTESSLEKLIITQQSKNPAIKQPASFKTCYINVIWGKLLSGVGGVGLHLFYKCIPRMAMKNNYFKILFFLFVLCFGSYSNLKAQDSLQKVSKAVFVHGSFYYDYPQSFGFATGIDFPIHSKVKKFINKNGHETISNRDLIFSADIGFYRYQFNHSGLFFLPSIGKRYSGDGSYYFEMQLGMGVLRTFYDGIVYTVDNSGTIKVKNTFGRYYAVSSFAVVFGHDFENDHTSRPFTIQLKPSFWIQYPYNSYLLPHLSAELGFKYHFKNFNIKLKQKKIANNK